METLVDILYGMTTLMLVPVIIALLVFLAWALLELGGVLREARARRPGAAHWASFQRELQTGTREAASFFEGGPWSGFLGLFAARGKDVHAREPHLAKILSDLEIEADVKLQRMRLGIRIAPMLGLMGTLIPIGPALLGLSQGEIGEMANNLVVAFATTVIGLLVAGICYVMALWRSHWYAEDMAAAEYIYRCLHAGEPAQREAA